MICPDINQIKVFHGQLRVHVINILLQCSVHFKNYKYISDHTLQHEEHQRLLKGYKRYYVVHQCELS
jgi:hypothetical protein